MVDKNLIIRGGVIPAVDATDLKHAWTVLSQVKESGAAVAPDVFLDKCSTKADPLALFVRATLISTLVHRDLLKTHIDRGAVSNQVIQAAAVFPLPNGLQGFEVTAFLEALGMD